MKVPYRVSADAIWILHFFVVVLVLFGWLVPSLWYFYMAVTAGTLVSELMYKYCILSKWEFDLRKEIDPTLDYEYAYASYYTYKLTRGYLSRDFLCYAGIVFTSLSLAINIYFKFFF